MCVWDLIDCLLIQKVSINFPTMSTYCHKTPEFGSFPLSLHFEKDNRKYRLVLEKELVLLLEYSKVYFKFLHLSHPLFAFSRLLE